MMPTSGPDSVLLWSLACGSEISNSPIFKIWFFLCSGVNRCPVVGLWVVLGLRRAYFARYCGFKKVNNATDSSEIRHQGAISDDPNSGSPGRFHTTSAIVSLRIFPIIT